MWEVLGNVEEKRRRRVDDHQVCLDFGEENGQAERAEECRSHDYQRVQNHDVPVHRSEYLVGVV